MRPRPLNRAKTGVRIHLEQLDSRDVPATFFVAPDGDDAAAGTSPNAPFRNIQKAVNVAKAAPGIDTILVAGGTYTFQPSLNPLQPGFNDSGERAVVTVFQDQVVINGGFSRADGFQTSNPGANPTIIDGENQRRGVYVLGFNATAGLELNGFVIRNGLAAANPQRVGDEINAYGGGLLLDLEPVSQPNPAAAQPTFKLSNLTIENNVARGGSRGNQGGIGAGGGLVTRFLRDVQLNNVLFRGNRAEGGPGTTVGGGANGGGLQSDTSILTADNVRFENNVAIGANTTGDGVLGNVHADALGGAAALQTRERADGLPLVATSATFRNTTATNNRIEGGNGSILGGLAFGGAFFAEVTPLTVIDSVLTNNFAEAGDVATPANPYASAGGGGVVADRTNLTLDRVRIVDNTTKGGTTANPGNGATIGGGFAAGVYAFIDRTGRPQPVVNITNSLIAGNRSLAGPGATNISPGSGGAMRFTQVRATINHSTIADNSLDPLYPFGTAIMAQNINPRNAALPDTNVTISNSIISNNTGLVRPGTVGAPAGQISMFGSLSMTLNNNQFQNPAGIRNVVVEDFRFFEGGQTTTPVLTINGAVINIPAPNPANTTFTDPPSTNVQFADAAARNYTFPTSSPAVNAGVPGVTVDISNTNRSGNPDVGAFEQGSNPAAPVLAATTGGASPTGATGVTPQPNRAPVAANDSTTATTATAKVVAVLANDSDPDGDPLAVTITANPANGTATVNADKTITYTSNAGFTGSDTIGYTIADGRGGTATATVAVTVTAVQLPPVGTPVLVGFPQFAAGADAGSNSVTLYNPDRSPRYTLTPFGGFNGGIRTAVADLTGDGVGDLIVGTGPGRATQVIAFDGNSKAELFNTAPFEASFTGGVYVAAGDVTGDGKAEIVVTPDEGGGPRVDIFNVADSGNRILAFFGIDDANFRGGARAALNDMNGDGNADVIVAAGFGGGPRVAGFDGKDLATTRTTRKIFNDFFAFEQGLRNGTFVAVGDVNGDGNAELIAGGGPGGGPRVTIFDAKALLANTQTVVANFFGGDVNSRGGVRLSVKNIDGDNRADLVIGAGAGAGSRVTGYLGNGLTGGAPPVGFDFDAFGGFSGGVFVG